jgi:hypothetical protein
MKRFNFLFNSSFEKFCVGPLCGPAVCPSTVLIRETGLKNRSFQTGDFKMLKTVNVLLGNQISHLYLKKS